MTATATSLLPRRAGPGTRLHPGLPAGSHPVTAKWVANRQRTGAIGTVIRTPCTGKRHETDTYRYAAAIPLRGADDALKVHGCEVTTTDMDGKVLYCHAFAPLMALNGGNVAEVVAAGRGRWKIKKTTIP